MSESTRSKRKMVEENKISKASGSAVWSEEDEVSLLKAMVDFHDLNQYSPYADMGKFLDFVKPCLHFDVQRRQLTDKLWKLKHKFLNSKYDSTIPHHANLLEFSKSIISWGQPANISLHDQNVVNQNVNVDNVVADTDGLLNVVVNQNKGKLVSADEGFKGVTKKRRLLTRDGDNVNEVNVAKSFKKKGKVVTAEDQSNKGDAVVVDDDGAGTANAVVNDVQRPKKKGKKRVKVSGDEHVARDVNREELKHLTTMFPELINMLELKTLSMMPQQLKKKCVMDTINTMGWEKANELEEGWADVRLMEMELKAKTYDLKSKQMNLILEATRRESRP